MTRVRLSQLFCLPTVKMEIWDLSGVSHNDSAEAIFIGC